MPELARRLSLIVGMSNKAALAGIQQLQGAMGRLGAAARQSGLVEGFKRAGMAFKSFGDSVLRMAPRIALGLAGLATGALFLARSFVQSAQQQQNALIGLSTIAKSYGVSSEAATQAAKGLENEFIDMASAAAALKNLLSAGMSLPQATQLIKGMTEQAIFNRQAHFGIAEAVIAATEGIRNENSILSDATGTTRNLAKMFEDYAKTLGVNTQELTKAQKAQAAFIGFSEEARRSVGDYEKALGAAQGQQASFGKSTMDMRRALGDALLPAFGAVLSILTPYVQAITAWAKANKEVIQQRLAEWVERLRKGLEELIPRAIAFIRETVRWVQDNRDLLVGLGKAALALAALGAAFSLVFGPIHQVILLTQGIQGLAAAISLLGVPGGPVLLGVAALGVALGLLVMKFSDLEDRAKRAMEAIEAPGKQAQQNIQAIQQAITELEKLPPKQLLTIEALIPSGGQIRTTVADRLATLKDFLSQAQAAIAATTRTQEQQALLGLLTRGPLPPLGQFKAEETVAAPPVAALGAVDTEIIEKFRALQRQVSEESKTGLAKEIEGARNLREERLADVEAIRKKFAGTREAAQFEQEATVLIAQIKARAVSEETRLREEAAQKVKGMLIDITRESGNAAQAEVAQIESIRLARRKEVEEAQLGAEAQLQAFQRINAAAEKATQIAVLRAQVEEAIQKGDIAGALAHSNELQRITERADFTRAYVDAAMQGEAELAQFRLDAFAKTGRGNALMIKGIQTGFAISLRVMEQLGATFAQGEQIRWKSIAAVALAAIASVLSAMAQEFAIRAAAHLIPTPGLFNPIAAAKLFGLAAAAAVTAGTLGGLAARQQQEVAQQEQALATGGGGIPVGAGGEGITAGGGGTFAAMSVAREPNITIAPSVTIEAGGDVFIGSGSIEEFKGSIGQIVVERVKDALETGEIRVRT